MPAETLHLAIVWHMHQPVYKDARTGIYMLPWVRLHAAKDYADMVEILRDFPGVRVTFNVVPSLIEQIEDYSHNRVRDSFLEVSTKPPETLSEEEKRFLLKNFFTAHKENAIGRYPQYSRLCKKALSAGQERNRKRGVNKFTAQELLDIQAFFNLVWIDPSYLSDPDIAQIAAKPSGFTVAERDAIIEKQLSIVARVTDCWRHALARGQVEISSSAYFHPILPLLCDASVAQEALPSTQLPAAEIEWPEDALAQLQDAVSYHVRIFGEPPRGLWPSEGGVSEQALELARQAGFEWAATDQDILARVLSTQKVGKKEAAQYLYRPYSFETPSGPISLLFRDKVLSNLIGFTYMNWGPEAAVRDFVTRLERIAQKSQHPDPLVTVVLDGENCWEYYENDGRDFLSLLYKQLSEHPVIRTTTPGEYLSRFSFREKLSRVPPGSWIDSNFRVWIGHPEDNTAWELLAAARLALKRYVQTHPEAEGTETVRAAWREIYIAEGSDWNWWYGDDHSSGFDFEFDSLFRNHLIRMYELLRIEVPSKLYAPVLGAGGMKPQLISAPPGGPMRPKIDGKITDYYEWQMAGFCDLTRGASSMRQTFSVIRALYYGYDLENLYVRVDTVGKPLSKELSDFTLVFEITSPAAVRCKVPLGPQKETIKVEVEKRVDSYWEAVPANATCAIASVVEMAVPLSDIGLKPGSHIDAVLLLTREGMVTECWPAQEKLSFQIPTSETEAASWTA